MSDPLTKVDSFQYPAGHLGHLTEGQQKAFEEFKVICLEKGYYKPAPTKDDLASHDDETLLRYVRARKFVPMEAFKQFKGYEDWKKENQLEELYDTIDLDEYDAIRRLYPQWTGRRDRRGIPVYLFEVAHLDSKTVEKYQKMEVKHPTISHEQSKLPPKLLRLFALYGNLMNFVMPLCSTMKDRPHAETPISQSNNIVDISGVGLRQFWNLKNHMQDASQLSTEYYPETLDRIFIIGAPAFFPTVWSWIKRWFDPITVSKMFILSSTDMKATLEQYIDPENIPVKYGGKLDFKFGEMPCLEPAIEKALNFRGAQDYRQGPHRSIPSGPIRWRAGPNNTMEAIAVGCKDGQRRNEKLFTSQHDIHDVYPTEAKENTPVNWKLERTITTDGTDTHPKEEGDPTYGADLDSGTSTPASGVVLGAAAATSAAANSSPANTSSTLPAQPNPVPDAQPVSSSQPREGTSETRAQQQDHTHASGQVNEGTPHVVDYGHHERATTIEPGTVGQAPKDVEVKIPDVEEPALSYLDQAKAVAGQAYDATASLGSTVASSVVAVVGGKKEEEPKKEVVEEPKKSDPRVEHASDRSVEEYLRDQHVSKDTAATLK